MRIALRKMISLHVCINYNFGVKILLLLSLSGSCIFHSLCALMQVDGVVGTNVTTTRKSSSRFFSWIIISNEEMQANRLCLLVKLDI